MKKKQTQSIFLVVLLLLTVAVVLVKRPPELMPNASRDPRAVIDQSALVSVDRVEFERGTQRVVLARNEQKEWIVESDAGFPADAEKLSRFFDSLISYMIERTVSKKAENKGEFGFGSRAVKVSLSSAQKTVLALELGEARQGGGQYFQIKDQEPLFLSTASLDPELTNDAWLYKTLLRIPQKEVQSVTWSEGPQLAKTHSYERKKGEDKFELKPADGGLKEEKITQLLSSLEKLSFEKRVNRNDASFAKSLAKPLRRVAIQLFSGQKITLLTGSEGANEKGSYVIDFSIPENNEANKSVGFSFATDLSRLRNYSQKYFFLFRSQVALGQ